MPELAFISLGSNIEPETYLPRAVLALKTLGELVAVSHVYQNPAVGPTPQDDYLNAAVLLSTDRSPFEIRDALRTIEARLDRVRTEDKYAPRTIDLDLCLLGAQSLKTSSFELPDPDILERAHLAIPLAELMPDFLHPELGAPLADIAKRLRPGAALELREDLQLGDGI